MQRRRTSCLAATVAAVAAIAFASGAVTGPAAAQATRLTKGKVATIAAHVVDQKAASLRVASAKTADTAGNSAQLAGHGPAAYRTSAITLGGAQLQTGMVKAARWTLKDIPVGTYLVTYSLSVQTTVENDLVECSLGFSNPITNGPRTGVGRSTLGVVAGSGTAARWDNHEPQITCQASSGKFQVIPPKQQQSEMTLVRLDDLEVPTTTVETITGN